MKKHFIRDRKVRYGGITLLLTVLVVAVTLLINAVFGSLATRYEWFVDMNELGMFDVTEDCYAYLETVFASESKSDNHKKVKIIFCDVLENIEEESTQSQLYHTATLLQARFPEWIEVVCYDILTNPNYVRDYTTTVDLHTGEVIDIRIATTDVVMVSEGYHRVYSLSEFFSFKGNEAENLWAYNGERKLAAGIMRAVTPNRPTVCFTNNHGEVYFDYELVTLLDDAGYDVTYIDLYKEPIPEACSLIITYNPMSDLVEDGLSAVSEKAILENYLQKENNAYWVFLGNASSVLPNFESFLEDWGADFAYHTSGSKQYRYMVQDTSQSLTTDGYTIYGEAITSGKGAALLGSLHRTAVFKNATAIDPASGYMNNGDGSYTKGDRVMHALYTGGENAVSWANGNAVEDADHAILMSLTEQSLTNGKSYVGVLSSCEFATETFLQSAVYGNADVICAELEFQGRENTPIGLTLKPFEQTEISTVTTRQMLVWTICLSLIPAVTVTAVAIGVLLRRRRT